MAPPAAPAWAVSRWFNTPEPLTLDALRGRVVMLHAFQMPCPGCVSHGIPQAQRVASQFGEAPCDLQLGRDLGVLMAEVPAARRRPFGTDRSQPVSAPDGDETGCAVEEDEPTRRFTVPGNER